MKRKAYLLFICLVLSGCLGETAPLSDSAPPSYVEPDLYNSSAETLSPIVTAADVAQADEVDGPALKDDEYEAEMEPLAPPAQAEDDDDNEEVDDDDDDVDGADRPAAEPDKIKQQSVAVRLATAYNVPSEDIMALHRQGYGFGQIAKAYAYADELGLTPVELLEQAAQVGWGKLLKENGLHPGGGRGHNLGAVMSTGRGPDGKGPPGQLKKKK